MKWFKHDSGAHTDAKLKKVKHKYGIVGYGLYFYCIELIASGVDKNNITFELEEDAETIALEWNLDQLKVQEIMEYMVSLNLFENQDGRITCFKLAKRLDDTNSKNPEIKRILSILNHSESFGDGRISSEGIGGTSTNSELLGENPKDSAQTRLDKNRLEEKRGKKRAIPSDFEIDDLMREWFKKQDFTIDIDRATEVWRDSMLRDTTKHRYTDWVATWRNGMRKAQEWYNEKNTPPAQSSARPRKMMPKAGTEE